MELEQKYKISLLLNRFQIFDLAQNGAFGKLFKVKDFNNANKM
jgi:hypothetical protein